ncbi:hypothetical protein WJX72_008360 [[Myrmecia] bisecta]|uniref:Uncharacterized protein n=1 Tax=[Myrmecia] bisecta TaxID=41462 RepID=A0AAW1Q4E9_9CHLO
MNWFPDREAFIVGLSLLNKVTGVVGLRHIYMRDNSPSWPHFAYSVIGFCGQWPMHFLLSLQLSMRLKLYVLVHVAGLAFVLCANSSMASHILQVPQNRARWRAIAETMSCAVRQVRSQDTLECLEAAAAIDEEWCCVVVWTVLQVSVGFVLPALITYYIEIKDRKRFQVANHGYAPLLDSYIANAFPAVILAPFMMMLAYHRPEMLAYLI